MKALFIGGTGTISIAVSKLALEKGWELYLLNRGNRNSMLPKGANIIKGDIEDESAISELIKDMNFDVVVDFIAFKKYQVERDFRLFSKKTKQFIFISSASVYQKPVGYYKITEGTPVYNPYWKYSQEKIECEEYLLEQYLKNKFPITIVRPSHTYGDFSVPVAIHGKNGSWSVVERIMQGKKIIVPGDGNSLWVLTHNTDFAKGFVGLMGNPRAIGENVHITSDEILTWNQIMQTIAYVLGIEANIVHISTDFLCECNKDFIGSLLGDKSCCVAFDNSKIKRLVPEYIATTSFYQGVKKTIDFILNNEQYQKKDEEFNVWTDKVIDGYEKAILNLKKAL